MRFIHKRPMLLQINGELHVTLGVAVALHRPEVGRSVIALVDNPSRAWIADAIAPVRLRKISEAPPDHIIRNQ